MVATRTLTVVGADGTESTETFSDQNVRFVYDDGETLEPTVVRDIERVSDRQKAEGTTLCGQRRVADDGDGKVEWTIDCFIIPEERDIIQQKKGVTGRLFTDLTTQNSVDAYIKKNSIALANDMGTLMLSGKEYQMFDCQLTVVEE